MNKVTIEHIKSKIKSELYMVLPDGRSTLCMLTLANGYTIKGMSACVDESNFDLSMGRKIAFEDAIKQIWPLEGYLLAEARHTGRDASEATIPSPTPEKRASRRQQATADAPWGYKKDGTPKQRPGRKVAA